MPTNDGDSGAAEQKRFTGWTAIVGGIMFLFVQVGLCRWAPAFRDTGLYNFFILSLLGLTGGFLGWWIGLVLNPLQSQAEGAKRALAAFSLFWSGVVVSHLQGVARLLGIGGAPGFTAAEKIRVVFGFGVFLLGLCVTFNTRFVPPSLSKKVDDP
jgi:hypothetical protein